MAHPEPAHPQSAHGGLGSYLIGFVLAVVLSAVPFWLVYTHALSPKRTLLVIGIAAVLQVLVHLRFFLHINFTTTPRENVLALVFTALLLFIMVGGSFWIMFDLHSRMLI